MFVKVNFYKSQTLSTIYVVCKSSIQSNSKSRLRNLRHLLTYMWYQTYCLEQHHSFVWRGIWLILRWYDTQSQHSTKLTWVWLQDIYISIPYQNRPNYQTMNKPIRDCKRWHVPIYPPFPLPEAKSMQSCINDDGINHDEHLPSLHKLTQFNWWQMCNFNRIHGTKPLSSIWNLITFGHDTKHCGIASSTGRNLNVVAQNQHFQRLYKLWLIFVHTKGINTNTDISTRWHGIRLNVPSFISARTVPMWIMYVV